MAGFVLWLRSFFANLTGLHSFKWSDVMWAVFGGLACPAISLLTLNFLVEYDEAMSESGIEMIEESVEGGGILIRLILFFVVVVWAPLFEEVLFRGMVWKVFEVIGMAVLPLTIITSLIFVIAHTDPLHIVGVLPIGFYLGWLRQRAGSTIPTIICHAVNNMVAFTALMLTI
jgi:membrane protease YdiL (CAAX protease family)